MNTGFYDVNTTGLIKTVGGTQNGYFDDSYFRGFALGPVTTADHFDMLKSIGAVGSVLLINARAQTASDAGQYAATNRANNYPVIAYELANEPQYLPCFAQGVMYCVNGSPALMEYLNAMEPIALAIFAADPNALVAISWMSNPDPSNFNYKCASNWTEWTSAGRQIYWNYTIMHPYPLGNIGNNDVPPDLRYPNENIVSYLSAELPPDTPIALVDNVPALIDEFSGAIAYNTNITGTLFEGIWSVEFGMRHARTGVIKLLTKWVATGWPSGVDTFPNSRTSPTPQVSGPLFYDQVQTAGKSVPPVVLNTDDTTVFNFNFFPTAQATAYSILGWATQYATTMPRATLIGTNYLVPTLKYVNVNVTLPGTAPAIYAGVFKTSTTTNVLMTNKGSTQATVDVSAIGNPHNVTSVSATDPLTFNISPTQAVNFVGQSVPFVDFVTTFGGGPVITLPPYSVVLVAI